MTARGPNAERAYQAARRAARRRSMQRAAAWILVVVFLVIFWTGAWYLTARLFGAVA